MGSGISGGSANILAIVPAHNEGPRVGPVVRALVELGLPVLVVDDGSADETAAEARLAGARVLSLQPNRGKGAALKAAFKEVLGAEGAGPEGAASEGATPDEAAPDDAGWQGLLTLDGDGQHDPAEVLALLERWRATGADLVIGARDYREMPPIRWFTNSVSRLLFRWALGQYVPDNQSGYRLRTPRVARAALESPEVGFAFEVEEIAICVGRGFPIAWVPIKTIYGTERSDIKPWTHFVSFLRVTWRARKRVRSERELMRRRAPALSERPAPGDDQSI